MRRLAIILSVFGCVLLSGLGSAAAGAATGPGASPGAATGPAASPVREVGLAGYHFAVHGRSTLRVEGRVTVPASKCHHKVRRYELLFAAGFRSSGAHDNAAVIIYLECRSHHQRPGSAVLLAGSAAAPANTPIEAGEVLRIRLVITRRSAMARLTYPGGSSVSVSGRGGTPTGVEYALSLTTSLVPRYSPVVFAGCRVDRKDLSAFPLRSWESVTSSGRVDGKVSAVTGSGFSITY